jgi:hypothetical protein
VDAETVPLLGPNAVDEDGPNSVLMPRHVVVGLVAVLVDQSELDSYRTRRPKPEGGSAIAHVCTKD